MLKLISKQKKLVWKHIFSHQPQKVSKKPFFKRYQFAFRILKDFIFVLSFYYSVHNKAAFLALWTDYSPFSYPKENNAEDSNN